MKIYNHIFIDAISKWGMEPQLRMTQEECAELIHAISKFLRGSSNHKSIENLLEEIADVKIMIFQLEIIFKPYALNIDNHVEKKIEKLKKQLYGSNESQ